MSDYPVPLWVWIILGVGTLLVVAEIVAGIVVGMLMLRDERVDRGARPRDS